MLGTCALLIPASKEAMAGSLHEPPHIETPEATFR